MRGSKTAAVVQIASLVPVVQTGIFLGSSTLLMSYRAGKGSYYGSISDPWVRLPVHILYGDHLYQFGSSHLNDQVGCTSLSGYNTIGK